MKIETILDQIDLGSVALPEFQRGYVWNRDQVRGLMQSLYRSYPVGSLLVWETPTNEAETRGDQELSKSSVKLLLDGQQRITSIYGLVRGKSPQFFQGDKLIFTDLRFHIEDEIFSFFQPLKMKDDPLWIDVTKLFKIGPAAALKNFITESFDQNRIGEYLDRLNKVDAIKKIDLHVEEVTGKDRSIDEVVEIFNRVNSGGTKLSKGDLALAKVCASWPEARKEMNNQLMRWKNTGYYFNLELLLRSITTTLTGKAFFSELEHVDANEFRNGLVETAKYIDTLLNLIASRLGLDHHRVFGGRYALPLMTRYIQNHGGVISNPRERDTLLYWYVHSFLWGRYSGSTESVLNQDLDLIKHTESGLERLIDRLRQNRGDLRLHSYDFTGWSRGNRFYPLLYMLTRVCQALDWETGIELRGHLLGNMNKLELHHIFPKSLLYKNNYQRSEVNALANFTFLTKDTNLKVSNKAPVNYLATYLEKDPNLLISHWIPTDPKLWRIENYPDFLAARRELLASAANKFLDELLNGKVPEHPDKSPTLEYDAITINDEMATEKEDDLLIDINQWVVAQGLPEGEFFFELSDPESGEHYGIIDLAWPDGLQVGLSRPVAFLADETKETEAAANRAGYRYFTDAEAFQSHVKQEILAI